MSDAIQHPGNEKASGSSVAREGFMGVLVITGFSLIFMIIFIALGVGAGLLLGAM